MKYNHIGTVICCIIAVGFLDLQTCGTIISHLDISSNYVGTLVESSIQTIDAWGRILNISAGIGTFGSLAYCILFNDEEQ